MKKNAPTSRGDSLRNSGPADWKQVMAFIVLSCVVGACSPAAPVADLPPLPNVDAESMVPKVAEQVLKASKGAHNSPESARKAGHFGMVLRAYNLVDPAEAALHRARLLAPKKKTWGYFHSESLYELGENDRADSILKPLTERYPKDLSILLLAAKNAAAGGAPDRSLALAERVLAQESIAEAWLVKATAEEQIGKQEQAILSLQKALDLNGPFERGHYRLAMLYRQTGQQLESDQQLMLASVHHGKRVRPYFGHLAKALVLNVSDRPLLTRAQVANASGDQAAAVELLEEAIAINSGRIETRIGLVMGYTAMGDLRRAEKHLLLAEQERPEFGPVLYTRGRFELARKQLLPAVEAFRQAVLKAPNNADAHAWLGYSLRLQNKGTESAEYFEKALAMNSKHPVARHYSAEWHVKSGNMLSATKALETLVEQTLPDTPKLLALLAGLYEQANRPKDAQVTLERGIELATLYEDVKTLGTLKERRARLLLKSSSSQ